VIRLDNHAFEQRKSRLIAIVDELGDVSVEDTGRRGAWRRLVVLVDTPGQGQPPEATFTYGEAFRQDGRGWRMTKYWYEYLDRARGGRLAYHVHDLPGRRNIFHQHCEPAAHRSSVTPFRSYDVDLLEAHVEFAELYVSDRAIDCVGLRPLRPDD